MKPSHSLRVKSLFLLFGVLVLVAACSPAARAGGITILPEVRQGMDLIYGGDPDAAIPIARSLQQSQPDHPAGFLLEGEALWWKRFCAACEIKYGMFEAWKQSKEPEDDAYIALADKEISVAEARLAKTETAEMHVYAGLGYALEARVYGLRAQNRNVARVAVKGRAEMLRALELDPQMADATAILGVYNYYVDTLSSIAKVLRVFMGIPGGSKDEGIRQLEVGMNQGVLMAVDARFIFARAIRQYDFKYEQALSIAEPLRQKYPRNPIFLLLQGNLNALLGRHAEAANYYRDALKLTSPDPVCATRLHESGAALSASLPQSR